MAHLRIVLIVVATAIGYGVLHDQVTIRMSPEYFSRAHPTLLATESPTLVAAAWGMIATFWVALPLGFLLAGAARSGWRAPLEERTLARAIAVLVGTMAACALIAGGTGAWLTSRGAIGPPEGLSGALEPARQTAFVGVWWAHCASYAAGAVGGLGLCLWAYRRRGASVRPFAGPGRGASAAAE